MVKPMGFKSISVFSILGSIEKRRPIISKREIDSLTVSKMTKIYINVKAL